MCAWCVCVCVCAHGMSECVYPDINTKPISTCMVTGSMVLATGPMALHARTNVNVS